MRNKQNLQLTARCLPRLGGSGRQRSGLERGGAGKLMPSFTKIVRKQAPLLCILALLVMACKTLPQTPDPLADNSGLIPLEPGALVYVIADIPRARPLLDLIPLRGIDEGQAGQILDRTQSAAAALYPRESGRRWQIAAWGNFPTGRAGMAFGMSRDWKKVRSRAGYPYWYSQANNFSVVMSARQAHAAASADNTPAEPVSLSAPVQSPRDFIEASENSVLACWLENPGAVVNRIFEAMDLQLQLPAERMYAAFFPVENPDGLRQYRLTLKIEAEGESQAHGLVTLFSLARVSLRFSAAEGPASLAAILFANLPVQDGRFINMETAVFDEEDIALLLSYFSLYSDTM